MTIAPILAAIITESNVVFSAFSPIAEFRDGIGSQWIPYGTYTDGAGSTEYLRVTSNLVGTIASTFDGYWEREGIPFGTNYVGEVWTNDTRRILDWINNTRRFVLVDGATNQISAQIEASLARTVDNGVNSYNGGLAAQFGSRYLDALTGSAVPPVSPTWSTDLPFDAGYAANWRNVWPTYAACTNDTYIYKTNNLPHKWPRDHIREMGAWWEYLAGSDYYAGLTNLCETLSDMPLDNVIEDVLGRDPGWAYPVVATNDYWTVTGPAGSFTLGRFSADEDYSNPSGSYGWDNYRAPPYPTNYYVEVYHNTSGSWFFLVEDIQTHEQLVNHSFNMPDDGRTFDAFGWTGTKCDCLSDDAFAHWRNGTRRFDWIRLGVLCQMERHMEETFVPRGREDKALDMRSLVAQHNRGWTVSPDTPIQFYVWQDYDTDYLCATCLTDSASFAWEESSNVLSVETNSLTTRCFPTVRSSRPHLQGSTNISWSDPCRLYKNEVEDIVAWLVAAGHDRDWTNGTFKTTFDLNLGNISLYTEEGTSVYTGADGTTGTLTFRGGRWWDINPGLHTFTNAVVALGVAKDAEIIYTPLDSAVTLDWSDACWPGAWLFDGEWVRTCWVPSIECMVAATNHNCSGWSTSPMGWDDIVGTAGGTNGHERVFRMGTYSFSPLSSTDQLANTRTVAIQDLNEEVHQKFEAMTGDAPEQFVQKAATMDNGEIDFCRQMTSTAGRSAHVGPIRVAPQFCIVSDTAGDYSVYAVDELGNMTLLSEDEGGYVVGAHVYSVDVLVDVRNLEPGDVRVDGHQTEMMRTLWKFKNLRDPSL